MSTNNSSNMNITSFSYRSSKGPYASNTYLMVDGKDYAQLTFDWSFDAVYFKKGDDSWITVGYGPKTEEDNSGEINTPHLKELFKCLVNEAIKNVKGYSGVSDKAVTMLEKKVNRINL